MKGCPWCTSHSVHRSTHMRFLDVLVYLFFMRSFQCANCFRRYYAPTWA
jgi:hypothetical protein